MIPGMHRNGFQHLVVVEQHPHRCALRCVPQALGRTSQPPRPRRSPCRLAANPGQMISSASGSCSLGTTSPVGSKIEYAPTRSESGPSYAAHAGLSRRPPIGCESTGSKTRTRFAASQATSWSVPGSEPLERYAATVSGIRSASADSIRDIREPSSWSRCWLVRRVATELDRFSKRSLCPSDRSGVNCRHRREVGGLIWLGLHGPSVVAPRPQTVGSEAACRCP